MAEERKELLGFCPECGFPIYESHIGENPYNYGESTYHCNECGMDFTHIIEPEFSIGDNVHWNDPSLEGYEDDDARKASYDQIRIVTDIQRIEDDTADSIVYVLDNETEVYGCEIEPIY